MAVCKICNFEFKTKEILAEHTQAIHNIYCTVEECRHHSKSFKDLGKHLDSEHSHSWNIDLLCEWLDCDYQTPYGYEYIEQHVNDVHGGFNCKTCTQIFSSRDGLNSHRFAKGHIFYCNRCGSKYFDTKTSLEDHIKDQHAFEDLKMSYDLLLKKNLSLENQNRENEKKIRLLESQLNKDKKITDLTQQIERLKNQNITTQNSSEIKPKDKITANPKKHVIVKPKAQNNVSTKAKTQVIPKGKK